MIRGYVNQELADQLCLARPQTEIYPGRPRDQPAGRVDLPVRVQNKACRAAFFICGVTEKATGVLR